MLILCDSFCHFILPSLEHQSNRTHTRSQWKAHTYVRTICECLLLSADNTWYTWHDWRPFRVQTAATSAVTMCWRQMKLTHWLIRKGVFSITTEDLVTAIEGANLSYFKYCWVKSYQSTVFYKMFNFSYNKQHALLHTEKTSCTHMSNLKTAQKQTHTHPLHLSLIFFISRHTEQRLSL